MTGTWLQWDGARPDSATFQGIDYVELQLLATHAELTVYLNRPVVDIHDRSFAIRGGRRVTSLGLQFLSKSDAPSPHARLRVDRIGDHSPYEVVLVDAGPTPIHPFFDRAPFVFTIDCPGGDCRPARRLAARQVPVPPAIDLLTKDYDGFVGLLGDRVRVTNPHWADLSPASLERVLVELLAHHADHLSYYQDRVAGEAFLDDATQRHSLRRHGALLGYPLFDGAAARTDIAVEVFADGVLPDEVGFSMATTADETPIHFFLPARRRVLAAHNRLAPAAWPGAGDAVIPAGAREVLLWGHVGELDVGQRLAFVDDPFSQVVTIEQVREARLFGWKQLPTDVTAPALEPVTIVAFAPPLGADLRPFRANSSFALYGNVATVVHGEPRVAYLNHPPNPNLPRTAAKLARDRQAATIIEEDRGGVSVELLRAIRLPDGPVLHGLDSRDSGPLLRVSIDDEPWLRRDHLHNSLSFDPHYVASADEDGSLWLEFGDGVRGREILITDTTPKITIDYWIGDPLAGNCSPGTLTKVVKPRDPASQNLLERIRLIAVHHIAPGRGGAAAESLAAARFAIPASLRHGPLQRAVALEDYATAARQVPGVARAAARLIGGVFNTVLVLIDPVGQVDVDAALQRRVEAHLERLRMTGREVVIAGPEYVPLEVSLAVCSDAGTKPHEVRASVLAALRPGSSERRGFFHPDVLTFGDDLELGDLLAYVQRVPGVRSVKALTFRKLRVLSSGPVERRIVLGPTEVARLDGDDDFPEFGRLEILMIEVDGLDAAQLGQFSIGVLP